MSVWPKCLREQLRGAEVDLGSWLQSCQFFMVVRAWQSRTVHIIVRVKDRKKIENVHSKMLEETVSEEKWKWKADLHKVTVKEGVGT